jgi:hypothetical protein
VAAPSLDHAWFFGCTLRERLAWRLVARGRGATRERVEFAHEGVGFPRDAGRPEFVRSNRCGLARGERATFGRVEVRVQFECERDGSDVFARGRALCAVGALELFERAREAARRVRALVPERNALARDRLEHALAGRDAESARVHVRHAREWGAERSPCESIVARRRVAGEVADEGDETPRGGVYLDDERIRHRRSYCSRGAMRDPAARA